MKIALGDRSAFPRLAARAYLSHAAISPPSQFVTAAIDALLAEYSEHGMRAFPQFVDQRTQLRSDLANLIHAPDPAAIGFVPNTTRGVTDVALCLPWHKGDRIVVAQGEFPANVTPWQRAAALFELELALLPAPTPAIEQWLEALESELQRGARLVAVSAVQFQTGLMMPLDTIGALCRKYDTELFVDAIQACGVADIDVDGCHIDYLSCGAHKWLMGVEGFGFLYVARHRELMPHVAGWLSHDQPLGFLFDGPGHLRYDRPLRRDAQMVEGGMSNAIGAVALAASVAAIQSIGVDAIFAHVNAYLDALEPRLVTLGFLSVRAEEPRLRSGILSLRPPPDVDIAALYKAIDPTQVNCTIPDGYLRFAPHWPNALAEVDIVVATIADALRTYR